MVYAHTLTFPPTHTFASSMREKNTFWNERAAKRIEIERGKGWFAVRKRGYTTTELRALAVDEMKRCEWFEDY